MFGARRGTVLRGIVTSLLLVVLVASCIVFVSRQDSQRASHAAGRALAAATPTSSSGAAQFTPAPGITVTVTATPPHGGSTSSSSSASSGGSNGGSNGASSGSTAYIVPPRYPTPTPTSSAGSGGGSGGNPSSTPTAGGSGGGASPTPTSSPTAPTATPTTGPALVDDAEVLSYSPTSYTVNNNYVSTSVTLLNIGTSTWNSASGFTLKCMQSCLGWGLPNMSFSVIPGTSYTFPGTMFATHQYFYSSGQTILQMYDPHGGAFGQQVAINFVNHGWNLDLQEARPSCEGDGAVWTSQGAGGAISCDANSTDMAQGGPDGIALDLHSTPASYDTGDYLVQTHLHFTTTSSSTFAGIIITEPAASASSRMVFIVSPAGYVCYQSSTAYCNAAYLQHIPASSDYDLSVSVTSSGTQFYAQFDSGGYIEGGISAGGLTGLVEATASGSADAAYFSNYKLYQWK